MVFACFSDAGRKKASSKAGCSLTNRVLRPVTGFDPRRRAMLYAPSPVRPSIHAHPRTWRFRPPDPLRTHPRHDPLPSDRRRHFSSRARPHSGPAQRPFRRRARFALPMAVRAKPGTMNQDVLRTALQALVNDASARSKIARLRELLPAIEEAKRAGVRLSSTRSTITASRSRSSPSR